MNVLCTVRHRRLGRFSLLVLAVGGALLGRTACAQQVFQVDDQQLISWVFNNQQSIPDARSHLETRLAGHLEFVAVIGDLQPEQRRRLELAGQGDIARYIADAETLLSKLPRGNLDQDQWQDLWRRLSPIRERYARGLNGRGSLFDKALRTTLDPHQLETYRTLARERTARHYRALVGLAVADVEIKIPLTSEQRGRLIDALMTHTRPPRGQLDQHLQIAYVLYQTSRVPSEHLQPIFSDREWKVMQALLDQMRGWAGNFRQDESEDEEEDEVYVD
ncbi:MAG: hypothetical protein KDA75_05480 [Planctomycetaceae bacterium]|nr:hypothetical protein [Planctomycetaceae bacterium]